MNKKLDTTEEVIVQNIEENKVSASEKKENFSVSSEQEATENQSKEICSQAKQQAKELTDAEIQQQKINEVEQSVSKQSSKKSKITNLVFFFINIALVAGILAYQLSNEEFVSLKGQAFHIPSLLVAILLLCGVACAETFLISYLLKVSTGKWKPALAFKTAHIGKYYDAVTPMATGGQAFQVSYLKGRGVPIHNALSVPLAKYAFSQMSWVSVSLFALIVSWVDKSYGTFAQVACLVGFLLGSFVLFLLLFLSCSKKIGKFLVVKVLKLLHKIKIIKNYEKQYEKITKSVSDFQDVMKQYASSPKDFLIMLFAALMKNIINYSIPFFIVKFFVPNIGGEMFFKMFVLTILVDCSASFFPLPGGSGMNELSFTAVFSIVVAGQAPLVWVMLAWRFCSYYFYLVQGVVILSYDMVYGNKKYRWQVVKNNLAEESAVFKQQQINRFRADRAKRRKEKNKF